MRQALEKIRQYGYSSIPMINDEGKYVGTISEGDLLWYIMDQGEHDNPSHLFHEKLQSVTRRRDLVPVHIDANGRELYLLATQQNFVPVIDDNDVFIGIVTRKDILNYCMKEFLKDSGK